jgi:hypothetical protein
MVVGKRTYNLPGRKPKGSNPYGPTNAQVDGMVDTAVSKAAAFGREGSSPSLCTNL